MKRLYIVLVETICLLSSHRKKKHRKRKTLESWTEKNRIVYACSFRSKNKVSGGRLGHGDHYFMFSLLKSSCLQATTSEISCHRDSLREKQGSRYSRCCRVLDRIKCLFALNTETILIEKF